ncbi:MAG: hypothetical protein ACXWAT_06750 [Methylobacter sp.]
MARNKSPQTTSNNRNQQNQVGLIHQSVQHKTIFDPDVIEHYSRLIPDAPSRILTVFEQNADTERRIQEALLKHQAADNRRRDWMAFLIIVTGFGATAFLAWINKPYLSGTTLAAIIGYSVIGFLKVRR